MYYQWILAILLFLLSQDSDAKANSCGYASCNPGKPGVLNVHLIPHTHDDVGWLKTVDEYYYGSQDNIQQAGVQYVLDTVIRALQDNPDRKFSYVEMAYFTRWWREQNKDMRVKVQSLVNEGRLQFLLGGWSMNDEADTQYTATIDQMTLGLDFLNQTFGKCGLPLVAWQIDPFGHSLEQSNLFSLMGFDANIFMRLDYRDKAQRLSQLRMELVQKTNFFQPSAANNLFTSVMYDSYCPPASFCFDDKCQDPPIMDDHSLHDYNVQQRVNDFANYVISQSKAYTTNHILVPMGCDFQFQNAFHNFKNLDKLIFHVNRLRKDLHVMYSTPACYINSVHTANKSYTVKFDDFFPYASGPNSYWTGYFTSRSALKGFIHDSNNVYQACKQTQVISRLNNRELNWSVRFMGTKMGVMQHHDAVTGTEKQHVAYDYGQRLSNGLRACEKVLSASLSTLITHNKDTLNFTLCSLANISYCLQTENLQYKPYTIVLYNSLAWNYSNWVRIPVTMAPGDVYDVTNGNGSSIPSQLVPITNRTKQIPERPKSLSSNFELIFNGNVPSVGFSTFVIRRGKASARKRDYLAEVSQFKKPPASQFMIKNSKLMLLYRNNVLANVFNIKSQLSVDVNQSIRYYHSMEGQGQSSGAYIFRPTTTKPMTFNDSVSVHLVSGTLVTEVHQVFSDWATLVTRLYKDSDKIESEWTVGPIPLVNPPIGKEVVLHYSTSLNTKNAFFTDSNSRQMVPRMINQRSDYKFNQTEPVAGNYYPVTSDVSLLDMSRKPSVGLMIHTDRAVGAGAYRPGMIETMLHRRMRFDDNFGVAEALNELGSDGNGLIVRGKQWFSIGLTDDLVDNRRLVNVYLFNKPITMFSGQSLPVRMIDFSALNVPVPMNVHITSLENHFDLLDNIDYQILRIENLREFGSTTTTVDVGHMFKSMTIDSIEELNISANQLLKDVKRLQWNTNSRYNNRKPTLPIQGTSIPLLPGEIRTFKITFKK